MLKRSNKLSRRRVLKSFAAGAAATTVLGRRAFAVPETIKIGIVGPKTGPLAVIFEEMPYAIEHAKKAMNNSIKINGAVHPLEFVVKDTQSNPNRASEVAQELILKDKVHIVTSFGAPETTNPVADQCELNGVPSVSNDTPLEPFFFGRHGDPKKGFEWTYDFFFTGSEMLGALMAGWSKLSPAKTLGVLWANDADGRTFAQVMPPALVKSGFKVIDPGRFELPANNFSPEIDAFKKADAELVFSVIPGPDFTVFFNQAAQQGFKPRGVTPSKACEFAQGVYPYGDRGINLMTEVWWSKFHPFKSSLTGQTAKEFADEYEKSAEKQASMGLGSRHSLIEVAVDTLKRAHDINDPASIRDALRDTDYASISGPVNFKTGPLPNCSEFKVTCGQWRKGAKWPLEMIVVDNTLAPNIPTQGVPEPMRSS